MFARSREAATAMSERLLKERLLREVREELVRADGKASLLLAAASVVIAAVLSAMLAGSWDPRLLDDRIEWLWWLGAAFGVLGFVGLGYAVIPRTKFRGIRTPSIIAFYGDIVAAPADELDSLLASTAAMGDAALSDQLVINSGIVRRKYLGIKAGMWAYAGSAVLASIAMLVNYLVLVQAP